jgi:hypothetical protein
MHDPPVATVGCGGSGGDGSGGRRLGHDDIPCHRLEILSLVPELASVRLATDDAAEAVAAWETTRSILRDRSFRPRLKCGCQHVPRSLPRLTVLNPHRFRFR